MMITRRWHLGHDNTVRRIPKRARNPQIVSIIMATVDTCYMPRTKSLFLKFLQILRPRIVCR